MIKSIKTAIVLSLSVLLFSCGSDEGESNITDDLDFIVNEQQELEISEEIIAELINSIPSPVETASIIRASGANYNSALLNDPDRSDNYMNQYSQAVALGIYGADLGYMNIYGKTMSSMSYLNAIRSIANQLNIGQFFDFKTLRRLSSTGGNIDSLLQVSTESFNRMNFQLGEQKRSNIGVLLVTGTWLESLFLTSQIIRETQNEELIERLAEQKITFDNLWIMLDVYKNEPFFADLLERLTPLKNTYEAVSIKYIYAEPIRKEVNGRLVIEDNSTSVVEITPEQVNKITELVKEVRNHLI
jgi:hypothetical protein